MRYLKINPSLGEDNHLPILCSLITEVERNEQDVSAHTTTQQIISKVERIVYLELKQYFKTDKSVEEYSLLVEDCKNYIVLYMTRNEEHTVLNKLGWIIKQYLLQKYL